MEKKDDYEAPYLKVRGTFMVESDGGILLTYWKNTGIDVTRTDNGAGSTTVTATYQGQTDTCAVTVGP